MHRFIRVAAATALFGLTAALAQPVVLTERFEDIQPGEDPTRNWTFGVFPPFEGIETMGSNDYLSADVDTCCLTLRTKSGNRWAGNRDYRAGNVSQLGFSTIGTTVFNTIRPLTLALINDNGTPGDVLDDFGFYQVTEQNYVFNGAPATFTFDVPSQEVGATPDGWTPWMLGPGSPADFGWDDVITDVDEIQFLYWDPDFFYIFQFHDMGVDNITITLEP